MISEAIRGWYTGFRRWCARLLKINANMRPRTFPEPLLANVMRTKSLHFLPLPAMFLFSFSSQSFPSRMWRRLWYYFSKEMEKFGWWSMSKLFLCSFFLLFLLFFFWVPLWDKLTVLIDCFEPLSEEKLEEQVKVTRPCNGEDWGSWREQNY